MDSQSSTQIEFGKGILFNWGHDKKDPFKIINKSDYGPTEMRDEWFRFKMTAKTRMKILKALKCFPQESYSMFAKLSNGNFFLLIILLLLLII